MQEIPDDDDVSRLIGHYEHFAQVEAAGVSPLYAQWAAAVAADDQVIERLLALPALKRQANLLFAAARVHGIELRPWAEVRADLLEYWPAIRATMLQRRTQTNEAGRIAVLNKAVARIAEEQGKPLALIEVGCAAGLCLYPDAWTVHYGDRTLAPGDGPTSEAELNCELRGIEAPARVPEVAWRAGIDLNVMDLRDEGDRRWLEALVWPGMEYRLERIAAGAKLVAADPPVFFQGDLNEKLPEALAQVPDGAVPVVFHSAVLAYLSLEDRHRFAAQVRDAGARWVSNEGLRVLPEVAARLPGEDPERSGFILAVDGEPIARTGPHGQYLEGLGG